MALLNTGVDIAGFGLHADLMFKLNMGNILLVNSVLVLVITCESLRISAFIQVVNWQAGGRVLLYTHKLTM